MRHFNRTIFVFRVYFQAIIVSLFHRFLLGYLLVMSVNSTAQETKYKYQFTLGHDNDITLIGSPTDWHYTYGIHLNFNWLPKQNSLTGSLFKNKEFVMFRSGLHVEAYTPDYSTKKQHVNIRQPFAGWGYIDFESTYAFENSFLKLGLDLGILGPAVQAGEIQNFIHQYISGDKLVTQWEDQIPNKLGINLRATYAINIFTKDWFNIYAKAAASGGTVFAYIEPSLNLRLGLFDKLSRTNSQGNVLLSSMHKELYFEGSLSPRLSFYNATLQEEDANGDILVAEDLIESFYLNASLGLFYTINRYSFGIKWNYTDGKIEGNRPHRYMMLRGSIRFN